MGTGTGQDAAAGDSVMQLTGFRDDDQGFFDRSGGNVDGYVIDIQRSYNTSDALHHARAPRCRQRRTEPGRPTRHHVKVCLANSADLDEWVTAPAPEDRCGDAAPARHQTATQP